MRAGLPSSRKLTLVSGLMSNESDNGNGSGFELKREFGWVRVSVDSAGKGDRCRVEDVETGTVVFLDALELASMCHATAEQRLAWLQTGPYTITDPTP
jgi:hypothetical protein